MYLFIFVWRCMNFSFLYDAYGLFLEVQVSYLTALFPKRFWLSRENWFISLLNHFSWTLLLRSSNESKAMVPTTRYAMRNYCFFCNIFTLIYLRISDIKLRDYHFLITTFHEHFCYVDLKQRYHYAVREAQLLFFFVIDTFTCIYLRISVIKLRDYYFLKIVYECTFYKI